MKVFVVLFSRGKKSNPPNSQRTPKDPTVYPCLSILFPIKKNGKTGMLGQDRLEVRWEAVMFLFNVVNLNV